MKADPNALNSNVARRHIAIESEDIFKEIFLAIGPVPVKDGIQLEAFEDHTRAIFN